MQIREKGDYKSFVLIRSWKNFCSYLGRFYISNGQKGDFYGPTPIYGYCLRFSCTIKTIYILVAEFCHCQISFDIKAIFSLPSPFTVSKIAFGMSHMMNKFNMTAIEMAARDFHSLRVFYTSVERFHSTLVLVMALVLPLIMILILVLVFKLRSLRRKVLPTIVSSEEGTDLIDEGKFWAKSQILLV